MIDKTLAPDVISRADPAPVQLDGTRWVHRLLWRAYGIQPEAVLNNGPLPGMGTGGLPVAADLYRTAKALQVAAYDPGTGQLDY
jgi:hypothetical protein